MRSVNAAHHAPGARKGPVAPCAALVRARSAGREPVPTARALRAALVQPASGRQADRALAARVAQRLPLAAEQAAQPQVPQEQVTVLTKQRVYLSTTMPIVATLFPFYRIWFVHF